MTKIDRIVILPARLMEGILAGLADARIDQGAPAPMRSLLGRSSLEICDNP
jgi:hypothetical protein